MVINNHGEVPANLAVSKWVCLAVGFNLLVIVGVFTPVLLSTDGRLEGLGSYE